jgi:hypothetical protein
VVKAGTISIVTYQVPVILDKMDDKEMPNGKTKCITLFRECNIVVPPSIRMIEGGLTSLHHQKVAPWSFHD